MKKVVIIGAGFGGLAAAIRLQARGFQVTLLEKNAAVGGHAYQFAKAGYTFDMGPSIITAPDLIQRVFQTAERQIESYVELIKLDPFYRIYFHDGSHLDYTDDTDRMTAQMAKFNPQDADSYGPFMAHARELYDAVITDGLGAQPFDVSTLLRFLPRAVKLKAFTPAYRLVSRYFQDARHRFTFSFHPLFIGGNPFRAPAVYLMIPYLEKAGGVWFAKGGMYSLVQAFSEVFTELGGVVQTDTAAEEIVVKNGRAVGVRANGEYYEAAAVVSNADLAHTYADLIRPEHRRKWSDKKLRRMAYSMSAFLLYIGVRKQYPQLLHHTLILSERYAGLVKDIFDHKLLPDDFSMYLHVPSRSDPAMAPEGCESMYVLIPVPNLAGRVDWAKMRDSYTDRILAFLEDDFGLKDFRQSIEVLETFTPLDFKRKRNSHLGSAWGVEPKLTQTANFRPRNRSEDIKGLYFVGANTHPGAGVPGVLLTAEATEKAILQDVAVS